MDVKKIRFSFFSRKKKRPNILSKRVVSLWTDLEDFFCTFNFLFFVKEAMKLANALRPRGVHDLNLTSLLKLGGKSIERLASFDERFLL